MAPGSQTAQALRASGGNALRPSLDALRRVWEDEGRLTRSPTEMTSPHLWPEERIARFWHFVARGPANACWAWTGSRLLKGYGRYRFREGKQSFAILSQRVVHILTNGPLSPGLEVFHQCGNVACCNPAHVGARTPSERIRETHRNRVRPRRNAKLTRAKVAQLRALKCGRPNLTARSVAPRFGISTTRVHAIWRGEGWPEGAAKPDRCAARAEYSGARCCRYAAPGARYCWQHG